MFEQKRGIKVCRYTNIWKCVSKRPFAHFIRYARTSHVHSALSFQKCRHNLYLLRLLLRIEINSNSIWNKKERNRKNVCFCLWKLTHLIDISCTFAPVLWSIQATVTWIEFGIEIGQSHRTSFFFHISSEFREN